MLDFLLRLVLWEKCTIVLLISHFLSRIFSHFPNDDHFFTLKPLPLFIRPHFPQFSVLYVRVLSPVSASSSFSVHHDM